MRHCNEITRAHLDKSLFSDFPVLIICCLHTRGFVSADLTVCFSHKLNVSHNFSFHIYPADG